MTKPVAIPSKLAYRSRHIGCYKMSTAQKVPYKKVGAAGRAYPPLLRPSIATMPTRPRKDRECHWMSERRERKIEREKGQVTWFCIDHPLPVSLFDTWLFKFLKSM